MTRLLPDLDMVPVASQKTASSDDVSVMENLILTMVDGKLNVEQLGTSCGLEPDMAQRIVHLLVAEGYLAIPGYRIAASEPPPAESAAKDPASPSPVTPVAPLEKRNRELEAQVSADIHELYERVAHMNYYQLLGVTPDAERADIRAAYFTLSKKYHPDAYYGKLDAELREKLGRVFHEITKAYDNLSLKSRRRRYDESIADQIDMWRMESELKKAVKEQSTNPPVTSTVTQRKSDRVALSSRAPAPARDRETPARKQTGEEPTIRTQRPSIPRGVEKVKVRRAARISRVPVTRDSVIPPAPVEGARRSSIPPQSRSSSIPPRARPQRPSNGPMATQSMSPVSERQRHERREEWKRERLRKALGRSKPPGPVERKGDDAQAPASKMRASNSYLLEHAQIALEQHEYDLAITHSQEMLKRDSGNPEASRLLEKAQSGKLQIKAREWIRQGRFDHGKGRVREALTSFERALRIDKDNVEARYYVAKCLLELRSDLARALELMREAVGMGGKKGKYYFLMAELFVLGKEDARALDAMGRAVRLDPDNREFQKKLKSLKK